MRLTWIWLSVPLALGTFGCGPAGPDEALGNSGSTLTGDLDNDGIADGFEDGLMQQYAPEVRLHPDDWAMPANVDWYLKRVTMRFSHPHCPDHQVLGLGAGTQTNLSQQSHHTTNWYCGHSSTVKRSSSNEVSFFLQPPDDATHDGAPSSGWRVYAHVKKSSVVSGGYDLQYWFFYAYDFTGVLDLNHEADWEHVTYSVDADGQLVSAYYAEHGYGTNLTADQIQFDQGHPVVYSALGTHASYPAAGPWETKNFGYTDQAADGGPVWHTWTNVVNVGEKSAPRNGQSFIKYGGRWGEIGINNGSPDLGTSGPQGPAFHGSWSGR